MGRWEPDARGRLAKAAMELYDERGYEQTTVAEIAKRAGLTERTFFRHFADKREVLFAGSDVLKERLIGALDEAPSSLPPIDAVGAALDDIGAWFTDREFSQRRQTIIDANPELQERERIKLASMASALAAALRRRGVREPAATLAAEMGIAVFRIGFERWIGESNGRDLAQIMRESLAELKAVTAGS